MKSPIFIVGANRSGTTLLRLILNAHSGIAIPEELNYFHSTMAGTAVENWREANVYSIYLDYVFEKQAYALIEQGLDPGRIRKLLQKEEPFNLRRPYELILESWAKLQGKKRWGEKTPSNLFYADVLIDMFPDAQFIHLVRDPRGGVASMQRVGFFSNDIIFNALTRRKSMTKGRAILESSVPEFQRMTVRYEDLVYDPELIVSQICDFLGERYEPGMLEFHKSADRFMKDQAANGFNKKATRPISPNTAKQWRDRLGSREVALVERICHQEMEEFDYVLEGAAPSTRDRVVSSLKEAYWHIQCWRNRNIRHYTVLHPVFPRLRNRTSHFSRLKKMLTPA